MDLNLEIVYHEFKSAFDAFITLIEDGVEKKKDNLLLRKRNFYDQIIRLEAHIEALWSHVYDKNKEAINQLKELRKCLQEINNSISNVEKNVSVLQSEPVRNKIYGRLPWIKQCLGKIHTLAQKMIQQ